MYEFQYSYMLPKYRQNVQLLYTDTDSFIYNIKTNNFYEDIKCDLQARFDTSDFSKDNIYNLPLVNKKNVGLMKDESNGRIIREFIGLRSKMYSYIIQDDDDDSHLTIKKRNKGMFTRTAHDLRRREWGAGAAAATDRQLQLRTHGARHE
ncbi:unnamed protein product [Pieris macdunnoughi]|uniref:DNA-directed DNA polymerase n=1 Tax=Pieris macdunnoughi TaxID=345717 RepID=A0A821LIM5_9NEOP|nr:unnamed protein product [Pieris macdunnoughi]